MARSRNIKPGFFKNEVLAELPFETRLLFIGLWTLADREGRLEDRPKRIKAELFAFDSFDVDPMLNRLQSDGFLVRYEAGGSRYLQIENFVKHQDPHYKEKASEIPAPPGRQNAIVATGVTRTQRARIFERDGYRCAECSAEDSLSIDHIIPVSRGGDSSDANLKTLCMSCNTKKGNKLDGEESNSRQRRVNVDPNLTQKKCSQPSDSLIPDSGFLIPDSRVEGASAEPPPAADDPPKPKEPRGTRLQIDALPDNWSEFCCVERPDLAPDKTFERFRDFWVAKAGADGRKLDWFATWRNWVRNEKPGQQQARASPPRMSLAAQTAAGFGSSGRRRTADVIDIEPERTYARLD